MSREVKAQRHKNGLWYANIGPATNGRASRVYAPRALVKTQRQANRWLEEKLKAAEASQVPAVEITVGGLAQLYLAWLESKVDGDRGRQREYQRAQSQLALILEAETEKGRFAELRANTLESADAQVLIDKWQAAGYSANYVANCTRRLKRVFSWASKKEPDRKPAKLLENNPLGKDLKTPVVPNSPERFAERSEIATFFRFARCYAHGLRPADPSKPPRPQKRPREHSGPGGLEARFDRLTILLLRVLVHSGARPGEVCGAQWQDVRWNAGVTPVGHRYAKIVVPPDRWKVGGKTGKARTIYLSPILTRALRREYSRPAPSEFRAGPMNRRSKELLPHHPTTVFAHRCGTRKEFYGADRETGQPWDAEHLAAKVRKIRTAAIWAGLPLLEKGPNRVVNYRFRHTAISTMLMMGIDVATVAELCGTSAEEIRRTYGHLLDSHLAAAANRFHSRPRRDQHFDSASGRSATD